MDQPAPSLAVPRALAAPDPQRRFTAAAMGRRIRVLFIVSQPTRSPAISVHAALWRFLDPQRVEVHILYNRRGAEEPYRSSGRSIMDVLPQSPHVHLVSAEFGPLGGAPRPRLLAEAVRSVPRAIRDFAALASYIRREQIDVIHAEEGSRNAFYALLLTRLARVPYVVHFHSQYGSWMARLSRVGVRRADAIVAVSSWTGEGIARDGVAPQRIFPVLNGVDQDALAPTRPDAERVRAEFGLAPEDPMVLCVAQLVHWKRQELLITAFRRVADAHPRARLVLAGAEWNPPPGPGEPTYTEQLRTRVAELELDDAVILAGHRPDVPALLAAADVFALPSVGEPFGLAFAEAMAMSKAAVAVAAGGVPEVVIHGETGLLGPPDDAQALADNLLALIGDPELRAAMGGRARARVVDELNCRRMADEIEAVYRLTCGLDTEPAPVTAAPGAADRRG